MRHQALPRPADYCAIPLDQAWYCESCRAICSDATCRSCASAEHTGRIAPWLDREPEPIHLPKTGVFLSVIPGSRKPPQEAYSAPAPQQLPRAS
ncbi:MAG TPA: hypothetical protein VKB38_18425 [Terracidiphilus sp.]|nr:hypothetical protein [Terracidiphilus sp.]